jgi:hypothetical protein
MSSIIDYTTSKLTYLLLVQGEHLNEYKNGRMVASLCLERDVMRGEMGVFGCQPRCSRRCGYYIFTYLLLVQGEHLNEYKNGRYILRTFLLEHTAENVPHVDEIFSRFCLGSPASRAPRAPW